MDTATDTPSLPLGAHCDAHGTNFSVFFGIASDVELCLFNDGGREQRIRLLEVTAFCRHGYLPGVGPVNGTVSGSRARGLPWKGTDAMRASCCATPTHGDRYGL